MPAATDTKPPTKTSTPNSSTDSLDRKQKGWVETMDRVGIPPRFQEAHLTGNCDRYEVEPEKAKALEAARTFSADGQLDQRGVLRHCLLLSGPFGTGKSWLATACFKRLLYRADHFNGLWRKFHDFIREVQSTYSAAANETVHRVLSRYKNTEILLLDDVGDLTISVETDDRRRLLYEVIDARNDHFRPTILTTNLNGTQLEEQFGPRTWQRILEMAALIRMDGVNYRETDA